MNRARRINHQTLPGVLIHHRQGLERLAIGAGIEHEVVAPHLTRASGRNRRGQATPPR